jgi:16S rRNA (cytidine1402-2'-O)-methyltransferase
LTKKFEDTRHGSLQDLADYYANATVKGEVVVLIGRAEQVAVNEKDIESALRSALRDMSVKDAAAFVAETFDVPKRQVYQQALAVSRDL